MEHALEFPGNNLLYQVEVFYAVSPEFSLPFVLILWHWISKISLVKFNNSIGIFWKCKIVGRREDRGNVTDLIRALCLFVPSRETDAPSSKETELLPGSAPLWFPGKSSHLPHLFDLFGSRVLTDFIIPRKSFWALGDIFSFEYFY